MPLQVKRLLLVFAIFIGIMLVLKYVLTPDSWREYGPYRGNAIGEIASQQAKYVQKESCADCHDSIAEIKSLGEHINLQCEICHGPGYQHVDDENFKMEITKNNALCLRCHTKNAASPKNIIKQIDAIEHNEGEECITCHNPHQPWL
ncbi:MAG: hypothetical protein A2W85_13250 [Bacteroidetes bacterium GWF2_41_31]|nr:MAG: hypothetical protein A2W85_13250 [Bacteroidetes bacterium GWF2_41_31]OFZ02291.1 MAG: hypothetical protein A2338_04925 [Bacteroidetes bacterium RIFOXYB12_FULL_41_6]